MAKRKRNAGTNAPTNASTTTTTPTITAKKIKVNESPASSELLQQKKNSQGNSQKKPEKKPVDKKHDQKQAHAQDKKQDHDTAPIHVQIITGSYDRILHGITATITSSKSTPAHFADAFLLEAHTSALRCLALSPPSAPSLGQQQKLILATGSTDERINLYHLSAHPPARPHIPAIPALTTHAILENPSNRALGSLTHHDSSLTALCFPTRGKLLSSAEDATVAVTRTRDWSLLTAIRAPIPKAVGRPSGDTAPAGSGPSGINDFAVHPSLKVMLTVGKGERCMRLWNLVTGKKAGVLSFERAMLEAVGEGKHSSGEGRKVVWGGEDEFAVAFERGVGVWGMDCRLRCRIHLDARVKVCRLRYVRVSEEKQILAVSTEDGCVLFYDTLTDATTSTVEPLQDSKTAEIPRAKLIARLGGVAAGVQGRIKDFIILELPTRDLLVVTGSSDGAVRLWHISPDRDLVSEQGGNDKQVGELLGTYATKNRITCLEGFVMIPRPEGVEDEASEELHETADFQGFESGSEGGSGSGSDSGSDSES